MRYLKVVLPTILLALSSNINATTIDTFEDLGLDGSIVSTRSIDGIDVTFSNNKGANMVAATYGNTSDRSFYGIGVNTPLTQDNVSGSRFISTWTDSGINGSTAFLDGTTELYFNFSSGVSAFGFTTIDVEYGDASLTAYDSFDQIIDIYTISAINGGTGIDLDWLVSGSNIAYATFTTSTNTGLYGIDDMLVSTVPVPAAAWLFGSALLGFFGFSRRKSKI